MSLLSRPRAHTLLPRRYAVTVTVRRDAIKGTLRRLSIIMHENKGKSVRSRYVCWVGLRLLWEKNIWSLSMFRRWLSIALNTRHIYYSVSLQHALKSIWSPWRWQQYVPPKYRNIKPLHWEETQTKANTLMFILFALLAVPLITVSCYECPVFLPRSDPHNL